MKKLTKSYRDKSVPELTKELNSIREEITKLTLSFKVNPPKDSNSLMKKRKQLAVLQTVLGEKIELNKITKK